MNVAVVRVRMMRVGVAPGLMSVFVAVRLPACRIGMSLVMVAVVCAGGKPSMIAVRRLAPQMRATAIHARTVRFSLRKPHAIRAVAADPRFNPRAIDAAGVADSPAR
jgi:hypothetical protein